MSPPPAPVLVIGNKNYSSWSLRPWLLLKQLGIAFTEVRLPLDTPQFVTEIGRWSPSGRVPVLHHGELVVWDSLAIAEYVNEVLAPGRVWPKALEARAIARSVAAEMHSGFGALRSELPMNIRARRRVEPSVDCNADIARLQALIRESRLLHGADGPWLFGEFSAADAMLAPVAWRFTTYDVPHDDIVGAWLSTVLECEAMRAWANDARTETEIIAADEAGIPV
ncbi:glutathione S-transferase family protein [Plasticicumulans sp.]|uniref:glutathione S-transferase family protein n=1 Tax=Plasticicumulans sp. TaxID=2307179 RepID=UPI002BD98A23|nr:glutathione S-transferase family protein [Pseudomonadota bacterium]HNB89879.1 glutathione S-transferase family protein [Plasticicumulans sp.]